MNPAKFFDHIREKLFGGHMKQSQVNGINAVMVEWNRRGLKDLRWLAYMLATVFHETAKTMKPVQEFGRGRGKKYGTVHPETGQVYYGRGRVQLTWYWNYHAFEKLLGKPLTKHPELMLTDDVDLPVMFEGMIRGMFTGRKLQDYFNFEKTDWLNARRIINGTDKMQLIANYAMIFHEALMFPAD